MKAVRAKLEAELHDLERELTVDLPREIKVAVAMGDLRENAEYHAAREQQGFIEGRIAEIEGKLGNAEIIDITAMSATGRVIFGATVDLEDEDNGTRVTYQIVGEDEADIKAHRISVGSPVCAVFVPAK